MFEKNCTEILIEPTDRPIAYKNWPFTLRCEIMSENIDVYDEYDENEDAMYQVQIITYYAR